MKNLYKTKRQQGFTIIEVMIVLAIAGLILLIVFLAVPALQRNSRNTQIRNDAAATLGAVNEYASNHNGGLPTWVCANSSGTIYMDNTGSAPVGCAGTAAQQAGTIRASTTLDSVSSATPTTPAPGAIRINLQYTCANASNSRAFSALFVTESAGQNNNQCIQS